jgi:cytochrome d ubiquinol oxidase subunit I
LAAYEGLFETESGAGLLLFGVMDVGDQTLHAKIALPKLLSFALTGSTSGEVPGLNSVPKEEWPPLQATFASYRIMMILGIYFVLLLLVGLYLHLRKRLTTNCRFLAVLMWSMFLPMVAIEFGWMATEIGRQPWIVQGLLKTSDAASAVVSASQIAVTLAIFVVIYALLFVVYFRSMRRTIKRGPLDTEAGAGYGQSGQGHTHASIETTDERKEATT